MSKVITDEQLDGMIKSAVASMGALPPDEKFSLLVNALRELRDYRKNTASAVPDGWKLVPMVPTEAMIAAAQDSEDVLFDKDDDSLFIVDHKEIYRAMLENAPEASNEQ